MRIANLVSGTGATRFASVQIPQRLIAPDVQLEFIETGFFVEPRTPLAYALNGISTVAAAVRAEREGFDAAFISSAADYGLAEAQAAVRIPVIGSGTAAALFAASSVRRFAVVQVQPKTVGWITERVLENQRLMDRCSAIRHVTSPDERELVFASMYEGHAEHKAAMIERICREIDAAVTEDDAEAIVLGCTCMTSVADELAARTAVPIVRPSYVGFKTAEQFVRLGHTTSTMGDDNPVTSKLAEISERINDLLGDNNFARGNEVEDCAVCAPVYADDEDVAPQPAATT